MFNTITDAIEAIKKGEMIIVVDDENRENEGDFLMAAELVTTEAINFMVTHGRGLVCMPMVGEDLKRLALEPMVQNNTDPKHTAFTVSCDFKEATTGISAMERAVTIEKMIGQESKASDFTKPGHIFPLEAQEGGVLVRDGHTEAAVDLAKLAGLKPGGVICEIMNEDGSMARIPDLIELARKHDLKMITIEDLIAYRKSTEIFVEKKAEANLPTEFGDFKVMGFIDTLTGEEHVALSKGDLTGKEDVLVRIHSECLTGDAFGSKKCDCGEQLNQAMKRIEENGSGLIIYMKQEGRGIGIINKIKAYDLQDQGRDTVDANLELGFEEDLRSYRAASGMLKSLNVASVKLMTNNPEKIKGLKEFGYDSITRESIIPTYNTCNTHYLDTKKSRMGHYL